MDQLEIGAKILVDASFFVAIYWTNDSHHKRAETLVDLISPFKPTFISNNYIVAETLSVLLQRFKSPIHAHAFGKYVYPIKKGWFQTFQVNYVWQKETYAIFQNQKKHRGEFFSFPDCTLIAQAERQKIKTILTFDQSFKALEKETVQILP